ncbi:MAG: hypothetical protein R3F34_11365 [Planctomycetota bacterium]
MSSATHNEVVPIRQLFPVILIGAVKGLVGACILAGMAGLSFTYFIPAGIVAGAALGLSVGVVLSSSSGDCGL